MTALNVVLGCTREMFMAALGASTPTWSFLEAQEGTTVTSAQVARETRLGDPINTGPNSNWHQLTWQGGAQQDIWADAQMYQKSGSIDVLTWTGKAKLSPGLLSWWKKDVRPNARGMAMWQGSRVDTNANLSSSHTALTCGERDHTPGENAGNAFAAHYELFQLHPGYAGGAPQAHQTLKMSTSPWRIIQAAMSDDYATGQSICCNATEMWMLYEKPSNSNTNDNTLVKDTSAPLTTANGFQYHNDTACSYVDGFYYGHGNRFFKRVPKPPYGVTGAHTMVHAVKSALYLQGMTVFNNRIYFGAVYPNGQYSVFISDGATTIKAFDFPAQFIPGSMTVVAGGLFINGYKPTGLKQPATAGKPNVCQQVWRWDGVSLKKIWQEGRDEDGYQHWHTGIIEWNGMAVWGCNGTGSSGNQTGVYKENFACLMFYDPTNDAIVPGPGLGIDGSNTTGHLWITGIARWGSSIAMCFRNDTGRGSYMIATLKAEDNVRNDFRFPVNGSDAQFQDPASSDRFGELFTSEYHGPDDVINEKKTWLALRTRTKFSGGTGAGNIKVYYRTGLDSLSADTLVGTITPVSGGDWQDNVVLLKDGAGAYLQSKKIQFRFQFNNTDHNDPDSTQQIWLDDTSVSYYLAPVKQRQWQLRIPVSEAQLSLHSSNAANSLTTTSAMVSQLEHFFFDSKPFLWWPPIATGALPSDTSAAVEVRCTGYQLHWSRLQMDNSASPATDQFGYVSLTLVENEPSV